MFNRSSMESSSTSESPYKLLLEAASLIPVSHYFWGILFIFLVFLYDFFEIHFLRDLFTGFRGQSVSLTFNPSSSFYEVVVSKCKILHSRYLSTPWLCSPHLQTAFLTFFGRPPTFSYRRQLFMLADGGTLALDWLMHTDVVEENNAAVKKVPLVIVIPGLTSDSDSQYVRHVVFKMAKRGWNVVVSNHRGLGGISITSDCFYNAGWTDDVRKVVNHLHSQYPEVPLFIVGTSIGANILVKYLGEDGVDVPIVGAAAICSTWDLLICDRFISRKLVQRLYDKILTFGLKGYAQLHHTIISRLADWEGIAKSRTVRDFDNYATCLFGKFETVDTYYRRCSSASYVGNVMVPLLCISALDDPVCTREAIPWDECRANKNVVLATTQHGGHLAYFEGITASSVWWVRAVDEFLSVLHSSPLIHREKEVQVSSMTNPLESSIDQAPYVNVDEDGMISAVGNDPETEGDILRNDDVVQKDNPRDKDDHIIEETANVTTELAPALALALAPTRDSGPIMAPFKKCLNQLSRNNRKTMWMLAYIAIVSSWPVLRSVFQLFYKKKFPNVVSGKLTRK